MVDSFAKGITFETLLGRIQVAAGCASPEELAAKLGMSSSAFGECREASSVPLLLLVAASYKLDVSVRRFYEPGCSEKTTRPEQVQPQRHEPDVAEKQKVLAAMEKQEKRLQREIDKKEAELSDLSRVREAFVLELSAAQNKLSLLLDSITSEPQQ